jgi:ribonuclease HI
VDSLEAKAMKNKTIRFYCDGSGKRPDGKASGFAWLREDTREKHIERVDWLTNNEAEYRAVISVLKSARTGAHLEVLTDSLLVVSQLRGEYRVKDAKLAKLAAEVQTLTLRKKLTLKLIWVPREENLAGKLF